MGGDHLGGGAVQAALQVVHAGVGAGGVLLRRGGVRLGAHDLVAGSLQLPLEQGAGGLRVRDGLGTHPADSRGQLATGQVGAAARAADHRPLQGLHLAAQPFDVLLGLGHGAARGAGGAVGGIGFRGGAAQFGAQRFGRAGQRGQFLLQDAPGALGLGSGFGGAADLLVDGVQVGDRGGAEERGDAGLVLGELGDGAGGGAQFRVQGGQVGGGQAEQQLEHGLAQGAGLVRAVAGDLAVDVGLAQVEEVEQVGEVDVGAAAAGGGQQVGQAKGVQQPSGDGGASALAFLDGQDAVQGAVRFEEFDLAGVAAQAAAQAHVVPVKGQFHLDPVRVAVHGQGPGRGRAQRVGDALAQGGLAGIDRADHRD